MSQLLEVVERIERDLRLVRRLLAQESALQYTGCRRTSGSHGVGFVADPLGTDTPPADWPHARPTPSEIAAAQRAAGTASQSAAA